MKTNTNASSAEMLPERITLTDEVLPSLPLYVSRVRNVQQAPEIEALLEAVELGLRNQR